MKKFAWIGSIGFWIFLSVGAPGHAFQQNVPAGSSEKPADLSGMYILLKAPIDSPLFSTFPLALINEEPVTLEEFNTALSSLHAERAAETQAAPVDYAVVLKRLINTRLAVEEARAIGIDELPEIGDAVTIFSTYTLRDLVSEEMVKDAKVDDAEVERLYKDRVREIRVTAVRFTTREEAEKMEAATKAGGDFKEVAQRVIAEGKGEVQGVEETLKASSADPAIYRVISGMKVGAVSPVIEVQKKFVLLKLEDVLYPEDPKAREEARDQALGLKHYQILTENNKALSKKYLKLDQKLFDSLDFEAETPGLLKLLEDKRILVEVKGGEPVTVGEYADAVKETFFHDIAGAIKRKKVNRRKIDILEQILAKKVLLLEARERGIEKTERYQDMVKEYRDALIFQAFLKRVIIPGIKISQDEIASYYHEHASEFSIPEVQLMSSLVFGKRSDAEKAAEHLNQGTDFKWIKDNAEGQMDKKTAGLIEELQEDVVASTQLPPDIGRAVAGARPGNARLYEGPQGHFYVLYVLDAAPSQPMPFESVKGEIRQIIARKKVNDEFNIWADNLWEAYHVTVFADDLAKQMKGNKP